MCKGESPVGSSVVTTLVQMDYLAKSVQEAPVIEWDIVEPYFLFFLRCSHYLQNWELDGCLASWWEAHRRL